MILACVNPLATDIEGSKVESGYLPGYSGGPFSLSIPFTAGTSSSYDLSSSSVELSGGACRLKPADQYDSSSNTGTTSGGFLDGTMSGVKWDSANGVVRLDTSTNTAELDSSWAPQWDYLVGYWKMENNWNDSKGSNTGTASNGASFVTSAKVGSYSSAFDGTDDYVELSDNSNLSPGTGNWTISVWFKTSQNYASISGDIYTNYGSTTAPLTALEVIQPSNTLRARFRDNGGNNLDTTTTMAVNDGKWHHAIAVRSGTAGYLYLDGVLRSSGTNASLGTIDVTGGPLPTLAKLSGANGALQNYFNGSIDELAVWSSALTASEVLAIYNRQSAAYSGALTSKVMNAYAAAQGWKSIAASTTLPFYKELPGASGSETSTSYSSVGGGLTTGLIGLWNFDETAAGTAPGGKAFADSSGGSTHLGVTGAVTYGEPGPLSGSVRVYTTNMSTGGYASASMPAFDTSSSYTVSAWVRNDNVGLSTGNRTPVSKGGTTAPAFILGMEGTGKKARFAVYSSDVSAPVPSVGVYSTSAMTSGRWYHLLGVFDSVAQTAKLYMDGALQGTATSATSFNGSGDFLLGRTLWNGGLTDTWPGAIDEVAIWSRALSADEVKELYRRGANRLKYQIRSCASSDCSDQDALTSTGQGWKGPDDSQLSYFSELHNNSTIDSSANPTGSVSTSPLSFLFATFTTAGTGLSVSNNQYFQYRAILESDDANSLCTYGGVSAACSPELRSVTIGPDHYDMTVQTVVSKSTIGHLYRTLDTGSFGETLGANGCSSGARYALSPNGTNYYYWNGSAWSSSSDYATASPAATISANLASFPSAAGTGTIQVKTFLKSDGTSACEVDDLQLTGAW